MTAQGKAYVFGLATVALWSTVASAFKLSLRVMDPVQLLFWASLFSVLALGGVLAVNRRLKAAFALSRREYALSALFGLLNPCLYYLVLFAAYDLLPAQEAQPLNYTWAVTLTLLSIPLLGQRISPYEILAVLVSYSGVLVISTRGNPQDMDFSNPLGVGLALGSTVIWALYWIYNTKDPRDPVTGLFLNFCFGFAFILAAALMFGRPLAVPLVGILGAAYVGFFEMGFTFVLWLMALKLSENTAKVGNLIFLSPVLSLVLIHVLVGEDILPSTYVGLVLILAGLGVQRLGSRRRNRTTT